MTKDMTKKYQECPQHHCEGIVLVDVETETIPRVDEQGRTFYYCLEGHHVFSVPTQGITSHKTATLVGRS